MWKIKSNVVNVDTTSADLDRTAVIVVLEGYGRSTERRHPTTLSMPVPPARLAPFRGSHVLPTGGAPRPPGHARTSREGVRPHLQRIESNCHETC